MTETEQMLEDLRFLVLGVVALICWAPAVAGAAFAARGVKARLARAGWAEWHGNVAAGLVAAAVLAVLLPLGTILIFVALYSGAFGDPNG